MENEKHLSKEVAVNDGSTALNIISWIFGITFFAIGVVNTFWGDDPGFGVFIILLSFVYFLPVKAILEKLFGFSIPGVTISSIRIVKTLLGLLIIWAAMGVGDLFDKIELMTNSLK